MVPAARLRGGLDRGNRVAVEGGQPAGEPVAEKLAPVTSLKPVETHGSAGSAGTLTSQGRATLTWLQLRLQLAAFAAVRPCPPSSKAARQVAHGTAANRHERDHGAWQCGALGPAVGNGDEFALGPVHHLASPAVKTGSDEARLQHSRLTGQAQRSRPRH